MGTPARWSQDNLLRIAAISGKCAVKTQYACQVISVSEDGRFVNVIHNTLEWQACADGDTIMINEFGKDTLCSATKPWVITDVPVEQAYERGQWKVRSRPRVGDKGILSVFYHDIRSLKQKGGFQAPSAIRVMAIDSCSWRPGLPNHADVDSENEPYPTEDEWELQGNGVKIKLTSPVGETSESPNKMEVSVGTVNFTIEVPQNGTPIINFNAPDGTINVNAQTANVNLTGSATVSAPDGTVTIDTPATTITGDLTVSGAVTASSTLDVTGDITAGATITAAGEITANNSMPLSMHIHTGGTITDPVTGQQVTGTPITIPQP